MNCKLESKEVQEIDRCKIVQQTSFWASVKNQQGIDPVAFNYTATDDLLHANSSSAKHTESDLLVLLRYLDNLHCIAYVPYGPKDEPDFEHQGPFLEELSEVLRPHLPANTIFLDLDQSPDVLMQKMKPKTRYNIRLSHRKGIKVTNHGMEMLDT